MSTQTDQKRRYYFLLLFRALMALHYVITVNGAFKMISHKKYEMEVVGIGTNQSNEDDTEDTEQQQSEFQHEHIEPWLGFFIGIFIIVMLILFLGVFYLVVLIVIWIGEVIVNAIEQRRINRRRRLTTSQLNKLPVQKWTPDIPHGHDACTICIENFDTEDIIRILPCSHVFHTTCIDGWLLNQRRKCPNCKGTIVFPDEKYFDESDFESEDENTPLLRATDWPRENSPVVNITHSINPGEMGNNNHNHEVIMNMENFPAGGLTYNAYPFTISVTNISNSE